MNNRAWFHRVLSLVIVGLLASAALVFAQADEKWKKQNDRGDRYEGRISIPVGNPPLELLSFVRGPTTFQPDIRSNRKLKIRFFLPDLTPPVSPFISARELEEKKQYWMEVKETMTWQSGKWNKFSSWPTDEVLGKEEIPLSNIGVTVRLGEVKDKFFAPAIFSYDDAVVSDTSYTLYLRPGETLKRVEYILSGEKNVEIKGDPLLGVMLGGVPFSLTLNVRGLPEGRTHLKITGAYKNRDGGPVEAYEFYHKVHIE